jgi:putative ABC transport system permease protein
MLIVTGVSLGLATQSTIYGDDTDYWIVPESGTTLTTLLTVDDPQLANVHATSTTIQRDDDVDTSTPVLIELVRTRGPETGRPEYVLGIGIVPERQGGSVAGIPTTALTPGDPYYGGGSYSGELTGEVVLSSTAADILNASSGDTLAVDSRTTGEREDSFTVTAVSESGVRTVGGQLPIAVFHLSELQVLTGASESDLADQVLVSTNSPSVRPALEEVYPQAVVVERSGLATRQLQREGLPLAVSVVALVIALVIGVLFVMTTTAIEVEADRQHLAVLAAFGFSSRVRAAFITVTTLLLTLIGAVAGLVIAAVGTWVVNFVAARFLASVPIAVFHPLFPVYAVGVAIVIGLLAAPYPLVLARRTDVSEELAG